MRTLRRIGNIMSTEGVIVVANIHFQGMEDPEDDACGDIGYVD